MTDETPIATLDLAVYRGAEPGAIQIRQAGTGNVLLRFEALLLAAGQLLETALRHSAAKPEQIDADFVSRTLAAYLTGDLDEAAEQLVAVSLDALTPRDVPPSEDGLPDEDF